MIGWLFGGVVKKFERAAKEVIKEGSQEISNLFDHKLKPLADQFDYVSQQRLQDMEDLETQTKVDIENLLNHANDKVKGNLEEINKLREQVIKDSQQTISQTNFYLENRINQLSLAVMEAIAGVDSSLQRVENLENQLFADASQLIDKIDEAIDGKLEFIRNELKRHLHHVLPNPLDKCRQQLGIGWKFGGSISDMQLYKLNQCYELSKLNENTPIDQVLETYGQLQHNAAMMAALVRKSPELRRRAIEDWMQYGLLCEFWRSTITDYSKPEQLKLQGNYSQQMLKGN
ncbi:hypothetical protein H5968_19860 [Sphaerospermopsis sp. LEGE 00249]|uniref:hypothetical protein n=1 Tax=Sphaerospermopsis sp. LEGE 00249 TaxID=1380707 RepID=UPI00164E808D|nr:hypothetical protein [Sphaerospermopsis sp. LEGE 00249]MBC5797346.1 hypothetical protein [Sphaerospermopsis sp. LEGE 00249]